MGANITPDYFKNRVYDKKSNIKFSNLSCREIAESLNPAENILIFASLTTTYPKRRTGNQSNSRKG